MMVELKQCPCGDTPTLLYINLTQGAKWMDITPDCCGEWTIEARTNYERDDDKLNALAVVAWNLAPRGWTNESRELDP